MGSFGRCEQDLSEVTFLRDLKKANRLRRFSSLVQARDVRSDLTSPQKATVGTDDINEGLWCSVGTIVLAAY
jgi:hypothetical protein